METLYPFEFVHRHLLSKNGKLKYPCCVCGKVDPDEDCFYCKSSEEGCNKFCFCFECSKFTTEEEMRKIHEHPMKPTLRYHWTCDKCIRRAFNQGISMCCQMCNFDCCVYCFWKLENPRIIH